MRYVGQKLALRLVGRLSAAHGLLQLLGAVLDSFFQQPLLLAKLSLRIRQSLNHIVEALTQELDLIASLADLDRFQAAVSNRNDAGFQRPQWTRQDANSETRDGR